ncbi:hypothetical protein POM88_023063 [Heracleum sosnowskyi]|uniref:TF-B3 domain-containing protein n=1 Tax=Heracleum sosnowskyi TaxID=360622 RepID=A0AAD8IHM4_9APIA|nr:hypothetical protein POM88_023063 [Heracleum sosnowskyi]
MSFAAAISKENSFGTLRVPDPFAEKFGHNIPRNIKIICKGGAELKLSEYVLGLNKLEDEKARSLFFSTAYGSAYGRNYNEYGGEFIDDGEESDSDDGIEEADDLILADFFATLSKSNVDSHCHGVYISKDLDEFISHWNFGQIVFLVRNGLQWHIGINVTNGRKRFSAGWSTFVDNNGLNENDIVRFSMRGDGVTFDVEVVVD